jgi:hypothetical protein
MPTAVGSTQGGESRPIPGPCRSSRRPGRGPERRWRGRRFHACSRGRWNSCRLRRACAPGWAVPARTTNHRRMSDDAIGVVRPLPDQLPFRAGCDNTGNGCDRDLSSGGPVPGLDSRPGLTTAEDRHSRRGHSLSWTCLWRDSIMRRLADWPSAPTQSAPDTVGEMGRAGGDQFRPGAVTPSDCHRPYAARGRRAHPRRDPRSSS